MQANFALFQAETLRLAFLRSATPGSSFAASVRKTHVRRMLLMARFHRAAAAVLSAYTSRDHRQMASCYPPLLLKRTPFSFVHPVSCARAIIIYDEKYKAEALRYQDELPPFLVHVNGPGCYC